MARNTLLAKTAKLGIPLTALALALAPPASADDDDAYHGTFEVHIGATRHMFDSELEDTTSGDLGLGLNLGERWGVELTVSEFDARADDSSEIEGAHYRLDGLYHFADRNQRARPYFAFGVGDRELSGPSYPNDKNDTLVNAGVGMKIQIEEGFLWRTDLRMFNNVDEEETSLGVSTGFTFSFGGQPRPASSSTPVSDSAPADSDNDGVVDSRDQCPDTPDGVRVDARGCALDSDSDGVPDHRDDCPNTARQYKVDEQGCPIELTESVSIEMDVQFALNSAEVREQYISEVQRVADFMHQFDKTRVTVEGHTDSTGAASYNQQLSQQRAEAVRELLIERFDLSADRVRAVGYGEERPTASNDTDEGRKQNRRVVGEISAEVTRPETKD